MSRINYTTVIYLVIWLLYSCGNMERSKVDKPASIYLQPTTFSLKTDSSYQINPLTGDSIYPLIKGNGDEIVTGVPVTIPGKRLSASYIKSALGDPILVKVNPNIYKLPDEIPSTPLDIKKIKSQLIEVDRSSPPTFSDLNIPTGIPINATTDTVPCLQSKPVQASLPAIRDAASYHIKYLDKEQGLRSSRVWSILEDSRNNIWFGTHLEGAAVYNGENFKFYTKDEGLNGNMVSAILEDKKGNLWFGTYYDGISMYNGKTFTHYAVNEYFSQYLITSLVEDSNGVIWIGTRGGGVTKFDGENFTHYTTNEGLSSNYITSILEDQHGLLWLGTEGGGLVSFNGNSFKFYTKADGLCSNSIRAMSEDPNGSLWLGTRDNGLCKFDGKTFSNFTMKEGLSDNRVSAVLAVPDGTIFIGTENGGLNYFNGDSFQHITEKEGLSENNITSIMEDRHGYLWIGTVNGGVNILNTTGFNHFTKLEDLNANHVRTIVEDSTGNYWFTTWGAGLIYYDGEQFSQYTVDQGLIDNTIYDMIIDKDGNLWLCGYGGVCKFDGKNLERILSHHTVRSLIEDQNGNIWFGTGGMGLVKYDGEILTQYSEAEGFKNIWSMTKDHDGNLWFATWGCGVIKYDENHFTFYTEKEGLIDNIIWSVLEDKRGNLWLGTNGEGLSIFSGKSFTNITEREGLSNNTVNSLLEDHQGNIWVGTENGLSQIIVNQDVPIGAECSSPPCQTPFKILSYSRSDGLKSMDFNVHSVYLDKKNYAWWGTGRSLTMLNLNNFTVGHKTRSADLDHIEISGKFIDYSNIEGSMKPEITFGSLEPFTNLPANLKVTHNNNHLVFHFADHNVTEPHKTIYSYKLEGLNQEWSQPTTEENVEFHSIPYGRYTFKVCSLSSLSEWGEPFEYSFTILPPWWRTWWAYVFYGLLVIAVLAYWRNYDIKRVKLKHRAEYLSELDQLKSRFFANISHEFRTPLTLILGPVKNLMDKYQSQDDQNYLNGIQSNAKKLLFLVNQLLDLSKLDAGKLKLEAIKSDLVEFMKIRAHAFDSLADLKNVSFTIQLPQEKVPAYFDRDKLEKIINNLLSNAFKFTGEGGTVDLIMQTVTLPKEEWVQIVVKDSGIGIEIEEMDNIFDRFYQANASLTRKQGGSGIGLALTKELVELHHGKITVQSAPGQGTCFTLLLPLGKDHLQVSEILQEPSATEMATEIAQSSQYGVDQQHLAVSDKHISDPHDHLLEKPVVLIVEDHLEMRKYIRESFDDRYQVYEAENGEIGLNLGRDLIPDVIISDIMMPGIDGFELCERVKTNELTSHIPVILLTAKSDRRSKLTGLKIGADDYLSKPFDTEELQLIVNNRITERKIMRDRFSRDIRLEPQHISISSLDEKFLKKVLAVIEESMEDDDFNVDALSERSGYSNMQFYRKIKALTGQTPSRFLRTIRLKRAAFLLESKSDRITQIAYEVGFKNLSYFNKCFKDYFGMTPTEYVSTKDKIE